MFHGRSTYKGYKPLRPHSIKSWKEVSEMMKVQMLELSLIIHILFKLKIRNTSLMDNLQIYN